MIDMTLEELIGAAPLETKCIFGSNHEYECGANPYWLPHGCQCFGDQEQFLCDYHAQRAADRGWEIYEVLYWGA